MLEIAAQLKRWIEEERDFAVATVVAVSGSAPRQPGAALAVDRDGTVIGSVSGGCVEGAVYEMCRQALQDGVPVTERFGYSDDDAFAVGLTCGGIIDIHVAPVVRGTDAHRVHTAAVTAAAAGEPVAVARIVDADGGADPVGSPLLVRADGTSDGSLGAGAPTDRRIVESAVSFLERGHTGTLVVPQDEAGGATALTVLIESSAAPPRMIVFGAIDFASALVRMGKFLGYHVTVCDARPVFATTARFPDADEVVVEWPHRYLERTAVDSRTVLCVLTHDAKFDIPLLRLALRLPVAYVGAMGSRRTHRDRDERLRQAGVTEPELARLKSPIGLDLGARTPEETAVSIAAEIIATRHGGSGVPLTGTAVPIHRGTDALERGCRITPTARIPAGLVRD